VADMTVHPFTYADGRLGHSGRNTAKAAAEAHLVRAGSWAYRILLYFESAAEHGLTDSELWGITHYASSRPRRVGLCNQGFIGASKLTRLCTMSKRPQIVWKLKKYLENE